MTKLWLNLRLFWQGAVLSYIALFRWLSPMTYLASKIVAPLSYMIFFVLLGVYATGQETADFYVIGNAMQMAALSGIFGVTMSISGDRWDGTLPYLFGTPANRMALFFGRAAVHVLDGILGVFIGLMWGVLLFGLNMSQTDFPALVLTILIATFSVCGLGLLMGCLSLLTRNVMFVNNTVFFLLLIFSGANVDLSKLPLWMQTISRFLPLTRSIEASRLLIAGANLRDVMPLLAVELFIGLAYGFLGFFMFRWFEFQAKKRGTLEAI